MQYTLSNQISTNNWAHYQSKDITKWIDPRAKSGQRIHDLKTGNIYIIN